MPVNISTFFTKIACHTLFLIFAHLKNVSHCQGMLITIGEVIKDAKTLMSLWKHECYRVIADRFTTQDDKNWFEKTILQVTQLSQIF